jgi:ABC-type Mn2+/Zn2+ transport system ATPase subunit
MNRTEPAVEFENATVGYADRFGIEEVTMTILRGEFIGVIGPNGAGKTTVLKTILGLLRPESGTVRVLGRSGDAIQEVRPKIGYLPQRSQIDPRFPASVLDVVLMGRYSSIGLMRQPKPADIDAAYEALGYVEMAEHALEPIGHLSGGQQQRAFIARSIAAKPEVLLLDEPTTAVDVATQRVIAALIAQLHERLDLTIVLVSHDINVVSEYVDKVAYINRRLFAFGPPDSVLDLELLRQIYDSDVVILEHQGRKCVLVSDHHG